jgi:putative membrane protein
VLTDVQPQDLPAVNAALNSMSFFLLAYGFFNIKAGRIRRHVRCMIAALICSSLFMASYLVYHWHVGSIPYPHHDWSRVLYFTILIPHVILAAGMLPFVGAAVWFGWRGSYRRHRRLTRLLLPTWMFVSGTGVIIYAMLYHL